MSAKSANEALDWWEEFGPASPFEWNFDAVPNDEIIACCLWEYARESKTIAMKADLYWVHTRDIAHRQEYERDPALKREHDAEAARIEERTKREGFDYDSFSAEYWKTDYPLMAIYDSVVDHAGDGARAWQRLAGATREYYSTQVTRSLVLQPLTVATVGELERLWKANSAELIEVRSRVRPENDDSEDAALWAETEPVEPSPFEDSEKKDHLTVALTIDFSRFTDKEISATFATWLKEKRPVEWKRPRRVFPGTRQKGRKLLEYRVALERLGLMRLLHFHSPMEVRQELPTAWKKIGHKEQDFRREIREACKFFRRLFPFLPEDELPRSVERFGVWHAPVQKLMDEMDGKKGVRRGKK